MLCQKPKYFFGIFVHSRDTTKPLSNNKSTSLYKRINPKTRFSDDVLDGLKLK